MIRLVVGLGNPGKEYAGTRHNVGFDVVHRLAEKLGCSLRKRLRFAGELGEAGDVWLLKPHTFMNRSGASVAAALRFRKLTPKEMLVVVDDADLPVGQLRLRASGGSGGHNGLRSIIESLGSEEFARLRIGIGRAAPVGVDITGHVLGRFSEAERRQVVDDAVAAVEVCLKEGLTAAMNQFNRRKGETI